MATRTEFAEFITAQLGGAERGITCKKMFGEYGLYGFGTFFAVICDDTLYLKPTLGAEALLRARGELVFEPPYDGAKNYLRLDMPDDPAFLETLVSATLAELPPPKPKKLEKQKKTESNIS